MSYFQDMMNGNGFGIPGPDGDHLALEPDHHVFKPRVVQSVEWGKQRGRFDDDGGGAGGEGGDILVLDDIGSVEAAVNRRSGGRAMGGSVGFGRQRGRDGHASNLSSSLANPTAHLSYAPQSPPNRARVKGGGGAWLSPSKTYVSHITPIGSI